MIKKIISLTAFLFLYIYGNSQIIENESCAFSGFSSGINTEKFKKFISGFDKNKTKYLIPVKFIIIRNNNGKSKVNETYLKELIQYLNYYYSKNNTGISFMMRPDFVYIDKSKLLKLRYYKKAPFVSIKYKSKECLNVIITEKLIKKKFLKSRKRNFAGTFNRFANTVIIAQGVSSSTLSHEIGHFLGLKHPHRGWKHKWFQEPVSRTKKMPLRNKKMCECKGDKLCDTPAEPDLTKYTDDNCNYTGWNVKDKYGEVYKPNTHNIMSYTSNRECRNQFTEQQIELMHFTLSKNKFKKFRITNAPENDKFIPDAFEPDNSEKTATEIFFNTPQTHSFHIIPSKNKTLNDTADVVFFDYKNKKRQNIIITLNKKGKTFPKTNIKITDKNGKVLYNKIHTAPSDIILKNPSSGKYYVIIKKITVSDNKELIQINIKKQNNKN